LAKKNADLGRQLELIVKQTEEITKEIQSASQQLEKIEKDYKNAKLQVEKVGLSRVLGEVLRNQRGKLPHLKGFRRRADIRKEQISDANFQLFSLEGQIEEVSEKESEVTKIITEKVEPSLSQRQRNRIKNEVDILLTSKKELLAKLKTAYNDLVEDLGEQEFKENLLMENVEIYSEFLDQRLLWIASNEWFMFTRERLADFRNAMTWLCNPKSWINLVFFLINGSVLIWTALSIIIITIIIFLRRRLKRGLSSISEKVGKVYADGFFLTVKAIFYTALLAAPWPLLMICVAWILLNSPETAFNTAFTRPVGAGLKYTAYLFFAIHFLLYFCRKKGVAMIHFRWSEKSTTSIRRHLLWLMAVLLPAIFLVHTLESQKNELFKDSLGRVVFIVGMVALAIFSQRVLRPSGGITENYIKSNPNGWLARLRFIWCPTAVLIPLALAFLSGMGYHYSALQLKESLFATIFLTVGVMIFHDLVLRWLLVAQRKLALTKAREKRAADKAAKAAEKETEGDLANSQVPLDIPEIDISTIGKHARHLLRVLAGLAVVVGLWWIWADEIPALGIFEQIELWHYSIEEGGDSRQVPVTLTSLISALLVVIIMMVATRNIPGVMEIAVLRHLPLDAGSRYAISTISRYIIIGIGLIIALNILGFSWSSLQWLVAALGVGIGFGLQEIVANFISGLILLFERPIRVGDTVTVGGISGTVSRIRIRATTITDWDRKELIIPNKSFITGELVNWTLSDPIIRIIIKVGIAYGSDTALAQKVLETVVNENPFVLKEPNPRVLFLNFGESSLDFEVRVFVRGVEKLMITTRHELHLAIDNAFREHGIEISFPQRDIHLRSARAPLKIEDKVSEAKHTQDNSVKTNKKDS